MQRTQEEIKNAPGGLLMQSRAKEGGDRRNGNMVNSVAGKIDQGVYCWNLDMFLSQWGNTGWPVHDMKQLC